MTLPMAVLVVLAALACSSAPDEAAPPAALAHEVVLVPTGVATEHQLREAATIIERRLQALGLASVTVRADGTIVRVTSDQELIADTAALVIRPSHVQFRPVLADSMTGAAPPTTSAATEVDNREMDVWLTEATYPGDPVSFLHLGPTPIRGGIVESAQARRDQTGQWAVNPVFFTGAAGIDQFNALAALCNSKAATCAAGRIAIVVDGVVISAPSINASSFTRDQIQISGELTEEKSRTLAAAMASGGLPVDLRVQ